VRANPISEAGFPTSIQLNEGVPLAVNYIMAAAPVPDGFDRVVSITDDGTSQGVLLCSASGQEIRAKVDLDFLSEQSSVMNGNSQIQK
jgi:hypothetical protein